MPASVSSPSQACAQRFIRPLFDGPIDLIGDVHGEIDALRALLARLGYDPDGTHPDGRRLVFLGDLVDRGPDTPAVLAMVMPWVADGRAQCVLGNHELNVLRGEQKRDNAWFHGNPAPPDRHGYGLPQAFLPSDAREDVLRFIRGLPLALEHDELRVVHACWSEHEVGPLRGEAGDTLELFHAAAVAARARLASTPGLDPTGRELLWQNTHPVKVLTSGLERRAETVREINGKLRHAARDPWWRGYDGPLCVFGHYWRTPLPSKEHGYGLFDVDAPYTLLGPSGNAMCLDYSVGGRWLERELGRGTPDTPFHSRLAALRYPEMRLVTDDPADAVVDLSRA